jgi:DnaJ-class molecular chaperone
MARKSNGTPTERKCEECNGFGYVIVTQYFTRQSHRETCSSCGGTGRR